MVAFNSYTVTSRQGFENKDKRVDWFRAKEILQYFYVGKFSSVTFPNELAPNVL